jgi:hypothetical protein
MGIPIWHAGQAFVSYNFDQLTVNKLDRHPNELANRLLADAIMERALRELGGFEKKWHDRTKT